MSVQIVCPCPPDKEGQVRHPSGDTVWLREHLDFRAGMTARNQVQLAREEDPDLGPAEILTILTEVYVLQGTERWTLVDDKGKPLPCTRSNIRTYLLGNITTALLVGDAADDAFAKEVMLPLLEPAPTFSPPTPIASSTSAVNGSGSKPPRPSRRSSTTTTPTDGTGRTSASPAGAYS